MKTRLNVTLMTTFVTLLAERSVSRAAKRLDLAQPTVSKQLNTLRAIFDDPLFIRSGSEMAATHRGREIGHQLRQVLSILETLEPNTGEFDPAAAQSHFVIATSDYGSYVILPHLITFLRQYAPGVTLTVKAISDKTVEDVLMSGEADLCLASDPAPAHSIRKLKLFDDEYVCVCRADQCAQGSELTLERFLAFDHLSVRRQSGGSAGVVESFLAQRDMARKVVMSVPSMLTAPHVLAHTDLVLTTTRRLANLLCTGSSLSIHRHPLALREFAFYQLWHERNTESTGHTWLRNVIMSCAARAGLPVP